MKKFAVCLVVALIPTLAFGLDVGRPALKLLSLEFKQFQGQSPYAEPSYSGKDPTASDLESTRRVYRAVLAAEGITTDPQWSTVHDYALEYREKQNLNFQGLRFAYTYPHEEVWTVSFATAPHDAKPYEAIIVGLVGAQNPLARGDVTLTPSSMYLDGMLTVSVKITGGNTSFAKGLLK